MAAGTVPQTASDWAFGSWAFAVEVAMVVGAGVVGYRLASAMGRGVGWLAAAGAVLLVGVFWAMWMSPNADHRLPVLPRVIVASCWFSQLLTACGVPAVRRMRRGSGRWACSAW